MRKKNNKATRWGLAGVALLTAALMLHGSGASTAWASSAKEIDAQASQALTSLFRNTPDTRALADKAKAVLIFPNIVKAGFLVGGQFGDGALRKAGETVAYYRSLAASYGFQAGVQSFGYVLFFMDEESLQYLDQSDGWEVEQEQRADSVSRRGFLTNTF